MEKNSVAEIILDQMGGKARLVTFTGAGSFVSYKAEDQSKHGRGLGAVAFSFPNAASRPNHVRITLDWNDTYTVEFMQFNGTIDRPWSNSPKFIATNSWTFSRRKLAFFSPSIPEARSEPSKFQKFRVRLRRTYFTPLAAQPNSKAP